MAPTEIAAVACGFAYILLAIRQLRACWIAGLASSALYALSSAIPACDAGDAPACLCRALVLRLVSLAARFRNANCTSKDPHAHPLVALGGGWCDSGECSARCRLLARGGAGCGFARHLGEPLRDLAARTPVCRQLDLVDRHRYGSCRPVPLARTRDDGCTLSGVRSARLGGRRKLATRRRRCGCERKADAATRFDDRKKRCGTRSRAAPRSWRRGRDKPTAVSACSMPVTISVAAIPGRRLRSHWARVRLGAGSTCARRRRRTRAGYVLLRSVAGNPRDAALAGRVPPIRSSGSRHAFRRRRLARAIARATIPPPGLAAIDCGGASRRVSRAARFVRSRPLPTGSAKG